MPFSGYQLGPLEFDGNFSEIYFRKDSAPSCLAHEVQHVRERVRVGDGDHVEAAESPQERHDPSAFLTMWRGDDQGLSDRRTILSLSSCRNSAFADANFSASSRRKREAMGGPDVLLWCSTSVPTSGRTLEGHTTSSNSARNAFSHSGYDGGRAGGLAALSAGASTTQLPVDPGDGGDLTALAVQAAAAETVAKDCCNAVSTRRLAAGSTNSLWLRKKSTQ
jgi:hypothetical protein